MTDTLADTPKLGRSYCPTCEPSADPTQEILEVDYCGDNLPDRRGVDEGTALKKLFGEEPAWLQDGGVDGARWCDLLHGRAP